MPLHHTLMTTIGGVIAGDHSDEFLDESDAKDAFAYAKSKFNAVNVPPQANDGKGTVMFFQKARGATPDKKNPLEVIITRAIINRP